LKAVEECWVLSWRRWKGVADPKNPHINPQQFEFKFLLSNEKRKEAHEIINAICYCMDQKTQRMGQKRDGK
jgi:hypothetical protein